MTEYGMDKIGQLEQRVKELEKQNAELVSKLTEYAKFHTTLVNIKADAYREGFERSGDSFNGENSTTDMVDVLVNFYRYDLREQEKWYDDT